MWIILGIVAVLAGVAAWVRLAPVDAARWHVALDADWEPSICGPDSVFPGTGQARAACLVPQPPMEALSRLAAIAGASPRTRHIAGSPDEGRITWETRSALWGFPDYTTAEARPDGTGARLHILARLRFGREDMGVNAARLRDWLTRY
ncbi:MAG: DUF1499 domain-containing protein [Pseudorhodobacter sp.]